MPRFIQADGASKGHPRTPADAYGTKTEGGVGSPVMNEAQLIQRGAKVTATQAPILPPTISVHPTSRSVDEGTATTFTVTAAGVAPLSYQWKKNGVNVGTNSSSYSFTPPDMSHNGASVTCTVTNAGGSTVSNAATLTVVDVWAWGGPIRTVGSNISVAASNDLRYLLATGYGGNRHVSSDFGATWSATSVVDDWASVAVSLTGQYQFAAVGSGANAGLWRSTNYGVTWAQILAVATCYGVDCSDDGAKVIAGGNGAIHLCTNGTDATPTFTSIAKTGSFSQVCVAGDGSVAFAAAYSAPMWRTTDFATLVAPTTPPLTPCGALVCSADGQRAYYARNEGGAMYATTDRGVTWATIPTGSGLWAPNIACSRDGLTLYYTNRGPSALNRLIYVYYVGTATGGPSIQAYDGVFYPTKLVATDAGLFISRSSGQVHLYR